MRIVLALFVFLFISLHNLPYLIKDQVLIWFKHQGIESPKLKSIDVEWFSGEVTVKGLSVEKAGRLPLVAELVQLQINYGALFDKQLLVTSLALSGVNTGVSLPAPANESAKRDTSETAQNKGMFLGPLNLTELFLTEHSDSTEEAASRPKDESPSDWRVGIASLVLTRFNWQLEMGDQQQVLFIQQAALTDFYQWDENAKTALTLSGRLNDSALDIKTVATPLPARKTSKLSLSLKDFPLHSVTQPFVPQLSAILTLALDVDVDFTQLDGEIKHSGLVALKNVSWKDETNQVKGENVQWQGSGSVVVNAAMLKALVLEGKFDVAKVSIMQQSQQSKTTLTVDSASWQGPAKVNFDQGKPNNMTLADNLTLSKLQLSQGNQTLSLAKLKAKGLAAKPITLQLDQQGLKRVTLSTAMDISGLNLVAPQNKIQLSAVSLQHPAPLTLDFTTGVLKQINSHTQLALSGINVQSLEHKIKLKGLNVAGAAAVNLADKAIKVSASPTLSAASLDYRMGEKINITLAKAKVSAKLEKMSVLQPQISSIDVSATKMQANALSQALQLAAFSEFEVKNAAFSKQKLSFANLVVKQLKLVQPKGEVATTDLSKLVVESFNSDLTNNLNIQSIQLTGSQSQIAVDESGDIAVLGLLNDALASLSPKTNTGTGGSTTENSTTEPAMRINVAKAGVSGNNRIAFEDRSVDPWYQGQMNITHLDIAKVNTQGSNEIPFSFKAILNQKAKVNAKGELSAFAKVKSGEWALAIEDLDMPALSPYSGKFSGYFLERGKLNLASKGKIVKGVLKGENKVNIQQLSVRSADTEATKKTTSSLNMPLEVAISILEDDNGNIKLDVPVTGSLSDPNFGYSSVIEIIAKKGLKQAAFGFLSKALQPYGALITLASSAIDAQASGSFITLAPVEMSPGKVTVNKKMRQYLVKIATMMKKRKKLRLNVCANAVALDKEEIWPDMLLENDKLAKPLPLKTLQKQLKNTLQTIADQRGQNVEKALNKQGVSSKRLFLCFPKVSLKNAKKLPQVTLGL